MLYAVLGEFESRLGNDLVAASHFHRAAQLADLKSEQAFLTQRLRDCEERLKCQPSPRPSLHSTPDSASRRVP